MLYEKKYRINAPELVSVNYAVAGIGSRFVGIVIDAMIVQCVALLFYIVVVLAVPFLWNLLNADSLIDFTDNLSKLLIAFFLVVYFVLSWGYHVYFETMKNGRTPGKRAAGTRVIKADGGPVLFRDSLTRNLMRIADSLPLLYVCGTISVLASRHSQRLGDLAAGTIVVTVAGGSYLDNPAKKKRSEVVTPPSPPSTPPQASASLSTQEFELVRKFAERSHLLEDSKRFELAAEIAAKIAYKHSLPADSYLDNPEGFLCGLLSRDLNPDSPIEKANPIQFS